MHLLLGSRSLACFAPLRWRPLLFTGKISYGLYMWHTMAFGVGGVLADRLGTLVVGGQLRWSVVLCIQVGLAYGFATLSFFWFERPFLKLKDTLGRFR